MKKKIILLCFIITFPLFSEENSEVAANEKNPPSIESIRKGKKLFTKHCISCHGKDGHGKTTLGKVIPNMPDLANPAFLKGKSDQELFDFITNGHPPMPSFKNLPEEERWDLVHYVRTFSDSTEK